MDMNSEQMINTVFSHQYQQQLYFQYCLQQQYMIQQMMFQQQNATMFPLNMKSEYIEDDKNKCKLYKMESPSPTNSEQNQKVLQQEYSLQEKLQLLEEDSEPRVNGHWTKNEHLMYLEFVRNHEPILKSKYDKKSKKIFKLMSQFIPTRTATQCRSHHQKFNPLLKGKRRSKHLHRPIPTILTSN